MLVGALLLVAGLLGSLTGRRRRVWFRVVATDTGSEAAAGGLARAEYASFPAEFDAIVKAAGVNAAGIDAPKIKAAPLNDASGKAAPEERTARGNALP